MRIKKYVVHSLPEALQEIRQDLGHDAVILETRKVKKRGIWGWLSRKEMIEVLAAQDHQRKKVTPLASTHSARNGSLNMRHIQASASSLSKSTAPTDSVAWIGKELDELKQLMIDLAGSDETRFPPELHAIDQMLKQQGILNSIRVELMQKLVSSRKEASDLAIEQLAQHILYEYISRLPFKTEPLPRFICLVGPTGVGKTTTVAKLAADLILNKKKKIGLITSDTYRIAAVDQLKTYAQILNVPLEVVYSPKDLKEALNRLSHCDHILMDTAGRNYLEGFYLGELKQLLSAESQVETFLVISMTSKYDDAKAIVDKFLSIPANRLILTKLDETQSCGLAINLLSEYQLPLAYVTTGQDVPDDIVEPDPSWLASVLAGRENVYGRSS